MESGQYTSDDYKKYRETLVMMNQLAEYQFHGEVCSCVYLDEIQRFLRRRKGIQPFLSHYSLR